jgi:hypothetical protein
MEKHRLYDPPWTDSAREVMLALDDDIGHDDEGGRWWPAIIFDAPEGFGRMTIAVQAVFPAAPPAAVSIIDNDGDEQQPPQYYWWSVAQHNRAMREFGRDSLARKLHPSARNEPPPHVQIAILMGQHYPDHDYDHSSASSSSRFVWKFAPATFRTRPLLEVLLTAKYISNTSVPISDEQAKEMEAVQATILLLDAFTGSSSTSSSCASVTHHQQTSAVATATSPANQGRHESSPRTEETTTTAVVQQVPGSGTTTKRAGHEDDRKPAAISVQQQEVAAAGAPHQQQEPPADPNLQPQGDRTSATAQVTAATKNLSAATTDTTTVLIIEEHAVAAAINNGTPALHQGHSTAPAASPDKTLVTNNERTAAAVTEMMAEQPVAATNSDATRKGDNPSAVVTHHHETEHIADNIRRMERDNAVQANREEPKAHQKNSNEPSPETTANKEPTEGSGDTRIMEESAASQDAVMREDTPADKPKDDATTWQETTANNETEDSVTDMMVEESAAQKDNNDAVMAEADDDDAPMEDNETSTTPQRAAARDNTPTDASELKDDNRTPIKPRRIMLTETPPIAARTRTTTIHNNNNNDNNNGGPPPHRATDEAVVAAPENAKTPKTKANAKTPKTKAKAPKTNANAKTPKMSTTSSTKKKTASSEDIYQSVEIPSDREIEELLQKGGYTISEKSYVRPDAKETFTTLQELRTSLCKNGVNCQCKSQREATVACRCWTVEEKSSIFDWVRSDIFSLAETAMPRQYRQLRNVAAQNILLTLGFRRNRDGHLSYPECSDKLSYSEYIMDGEMFRELGKDGLPDTCDFEGVTEEDRFSLECFIAFSYRYTLYVLWCKK